LSILDKIIKVKKLEVAKLKSKQDLSELKSQALNLKTYRKSFYDSLKSSPKPAIIAEVKRASPSKGVIREDLDPVQTAIEYSNAGAACLSVLTDTEFFQGKKSYILKIKNKLKETCPAVLRKDFIIDSYQIWESLALGADSILLIVAALSTESLKELILESREAGLDVLIEIHNEPELEKLCEALTNVEQSLPNLVIGINNRDLNSFETNLETTKNLATKVKAKSQFNESLLITESGIFTSDELIQLESYGAEGFLIGESLVAKGSPEANLKALIEGFKEQGQKKS